MNCFLVLIYTVYLTGSGFGERLGSFTLNQQREQCVKTLSWQLGSFTVRPVWVLWCIQAKARASFTWSASACSPQRKSIVVVWSGAAPTQQQLKKIAAPRRSDCKIWPSNERSRWCWLPVRSKSSHVKILKLKSSAGWTCRYFIEGFRLDSAPDPCADWNISVFKPSIEFWTSVTICLLRRLGYSRCSHTFTADLQKLKISFLTHEY